MGVTFKMQDKTIKYNDKYFMQKAIKKAWRHQLLTYPNPAVGCVIVKDNKIISIASHKKSGKAHAELKAIKKAYIKLVIDKLSSKTKNQKAFISSSNPQKIYDYLIKHHNSFLNKCEIYVTLEPCNHIGKTPSCASLIATLKPKRVIVAIKDKNKIAKNGIDTIKNANIKTKVGVCSKKAKKLYSVFLQYGDNFVFAKMAIRGDGSVSRDKMSKYISSTKALKYVHKLRSVISLLIIGGASVRNDRPALNVRYAKNKSNQPDVLIYSKEKNFDTSIPLFGIKNRQVTITNNLNDAFNHKSNKYKKTFAMFETGLNGLANLNKLSKNNAFGINILLLLVSKESKKTFKYKQLGYSKIHSFDINKKDKAVFLQAI